MPIAIATHAKCLDGQFAAFLLKKSYPEATVYECRHGSAPPNISGCEIVMADFCYDFPTMCNLLETNNLMRLMDHHEGQRETIRLLREKYDVSRLGITFDNNRSGTGIVADAYGYRNEIVDAIEANDLWKATDDQKAIVEYIRAYEGDNPFAVYEQVYNLRGQGVAPVIAKGRAIVDAKKQNVKNVAAQAHEEYVAGHKVWVANAPYIMCSELGHELVRDRPFSVVYSYDGSQRKWKLSFRSNDFDTIPIAKMFGGGGHKSASGATVSQLPWVESDVDD